MNLQPPSSEKKMKQEIRGRLLLAASLVLLACAVLSALALTPAEVALVFFSPPPAEASQATTTNAEDSSAIAHTKALLAAIQPVEASSSLDDISTALAAAGQGVSINDISYSPSAKTLTLAGSAQTPDEVNSLREALQNDTQFSDITVPVSALLGSQDGSFTITMNVMN